MNKPVAALPAGTDASAAAPADVPTAVPDVVPAIVPEIVPADVHVNVGPPTTAASVAPLVEPPALRITPDDEIKRVRLVRMKRTATAMLVVVAILFAVARTFESRWPWLAWVRAFCEAAMVGGIADWFAVTALFRHPMGIPIPHTAIVPARKDRIGKALGNFVPRNFLTREVVTSKLYAMRLGERAARWLAEPENSRRLARHVARGMSGAVNVLRDDDVQLLVDRGIVSRLRTVQAAPLLARLFDLLTSGGRHHALLDDALRLVARFVDENDEVIRERIKKESPWWVPGAVENRLHDKIVSGVEKTLQDVAADPLHPLRLRYDEAVRRFVESLRTSPDVIAKAEQIKLDVLAHPAVAEFSRSVWSDIRLRVTNYADQLASDQESEPDQIEKWLGGLGRAVLADPDLSAKVDGWVVELVTYAVEQARDEVAKLIATTVESWDANATSRKIELQIGRDLQFIRINGTVVGGLVGVLLYALARVW
jgi:uncharacterized membrane-anchored protein YjiN (DUF445 family)